MNPIRSLFKQTAVYGLSNVVGRFLSFLLTPYYIRCLNDTARFGILSYFFAYIAFLNVVYTYGMETAYFRFMQDEKDKEGAYPTAFMSLFISSILLSILLTLLAKPLATLIGYPEQWFMVVLSAIVLLTDTIAVLPFAKLRFENKSGKFAGLKLLNIITNIGFNVLFLAVLPAFIVKFPILGEYWFMEYFSEPYFLHLIFLSLVLANALSLVLLLPHFPDLKLKIDWVLWKKMINYALPIMVIGIAGMINEMLDRTMLIHWLPVDKAEAARQNGIYGAAYRLAMLMAIFTQTFRMGAEPFFFAQSKNKDAKEIYAQVMQIFVAIGTVFFVGVMVMLYSPTVAKPYTLSGKFFGVDNLDYFEGLVVIPILFIARLLFGMYYNMSIWFKLKDMNYVGSYLSIGGAVITVAGNIYAIPRYGFVGCAYTTLVCYGSMVVACYILGQKYYPVPYNLPRIFTYILSAVATYKLAEYWESKIEFGGVLPVLAFKVLFVIMFTVYIIFMERKNIGQAFGKKAIK